MILEAQRESLDCDLFLQNRALPILLLHSMTKNNRLILNNKHSNRYLIQCISKDGGEAVCFSTPIYQKNSKNLIIREFTQEKGYYRFIGSNCEVRVTGSQITMFQQGKKVSFHFPITIDWKIHRGLLRSPNCVLIPTYNGVAVGGNLELLCFDVLIDFFYQNIRRNRTCLCFMEDKYSPIFVVSSHYTLDDQKNKIPLSIRYVDNSNKCGVLSFETPIHSYAYGVLELNFYEPKLLQDTPVSSRYPDENNAFGAIAYVGESDYYGSQWLYFRLDLSKMLEMKSVNIKEIKLYVPSWNDMNVSLQLCDLSNRFCSFGGAWNNKVEPRATSKEITKEENFLCFDLTEAYTCRGKLVQSAGTVLLFHTCEKQKYQILSTGDCCIMPPFLWIKFDNINKERESRM